MKRMRMLNWYFLAVTTGLMLVARAQGNTIDVLLHNQMVETSRAMNQSKEIARLQRELNLHLDVNERLQLQIDFLSQQSDVLMAAHRSGRAGKKLIEAWRKSMGL
jgi:hypothetical protein